MKKTITSLFCLISVIIASFIKMTPIVGSSYSYFSAKTLFVPLMGAFGGLVGSFILLLFRLCFRFFIFQSISLSFLAFVIPGFCASAYYASKNSLIRLYLPLFCMILFALHPVGAQVLPYSLYWLIPVILYFIPRTTIFFESLGSTFVAHAVGSVIWLYTIPMTPALLWSLIPIVAIERLFLALAMTVMYHIICYCADYASSLLQLIIVKYKHCFTAYKG